MEPNPLSMSGNTRMKLTNDSFDKASETIREREAKLRMKKELSNSNYEPYHLTKSLATKRI